MDIYCMCFEVEVYSMDYNSGINTTHTHIHISDNDIDIDIARTCEKREVKTKKNEMVG